MTAAALAAVAWGLSDFLAGLLSRRLPLLTVLIGSKIAAMLLAITFILARGVPPPDDPRLLLGVAAGLIGLPAMGLLYRAMRDGSLAVVAPIAAVAALVPVAWGMLHGERLGLVAGLGVAIGLAGVTMASWPIPASARRRVRRSANLCALGAALGFGVYFVLLHEAGVADQYWSVALARITAGTAALILAAAIARPRRQAANLATTRAASQPASRPGTPAQHETATRAVGNRQDRPVHHPDPRPPRGDPTARRERDSRYPQAVFGLGLGTAVSVAVVGAADAVADAAFIQAAAAALAPAAVVSSLYPAVTLILTW
jgi:uncharacterized membrane protein